MTVIGKTVEQIQKARAKKKSIVMQQNMFNNLNQKVNQNFEQFVRKGGKVSMDEIQGMRGNLKNVYQEVLIDEGMKQTQAAQKQRTEVQKLAKENENVQNKVKEGEKAVNDTFAHIEKKIYEGAIEKHAFYRGKVKHAEMDKLWAQQEKLGKNVKKGKVSTGRFVL